MPWSVCISYISSVQSKGGESTFSCNRWMTGKMSKLKAIDKIYFEFNKTSDIDLYVITSKERKWGLDYISMKETHTWNSEKFQFTSHFDMKHWYQVRALRAPVLWANDYFHCLLVQLNRELNSKKSFITEPRWSSTLCRGWDWNSKKSLINWRCYLG